MAAARSERDRWLQQYFSENPDASVLDACRDLEKQKIYKFSIDEVRFFRRSFRKTRDALPLPNPVLPAVVVQNLQKKPIEPPIAPQPVVQEKPVMEAKPEPKNGASDQKKEQSKPIQVPLAPALKPFRLITYQANGKANHIEVTFDKVSDAISDLIDQGVDPDCVKIWAPVKTKRIVTIVEDE